LLIPLPIPLPIPLAISAMGRNQAKAKAAKDSKLQVDLYRFFSNSSTNREQSTLKGVASSKGIEQPILGKYNFSIALP